MPTVASFQAALQASSSSSQAAPSVSPWSGLSYSRSTPSTSSLQSPIKLAPHASDLKTRAKRTRKLSSTRRHKRVHSQEDRPCPIVSPERASFDELPWASLLNMEPEPEQPYFDISELGSLFDDEELYHGPGPVRRRKTLLPSHQTSAPLPPSIPSRSLEPRLLSATFQEQLTTSRPHTPIRDTKPFSTVRFRNLMPDFGGHAPHGPLSSSAIF